MTGDRKVHIVEIGNNLGFILTLFWLLAFIWLATR